MLIRLKKWFLVIATITWIDFLGGGKVYVNGNNHSVVSHEIVNADYKSNGTDNPSKTYAVLTREYVDNVTRLVNTDTMETNDQYPTGQNIRHIKLNETYLPYDPTTQPYDPTTQPVSSKPANQHNELDINTSNISLNTDLVTKQMAANSANKSINQVAKSSLDVLHHYDPSTVQPSILVQGNLNKNVQQEGNVSFDIEENQNQSMEVSAFSSILWNTIYNATGVQENKASHITSNKYRDNSDRDWKEEMNKPENERNGLEASNFYRPNYINNTFGTANDVRDDNSNPGVNVSIEVTEVKVNTTMDLMASNYSNEINNVIIDHRDTRPKLLEHATLLNDANIENSTSNNTNITRGNLEIVHTVFKILHPTRPVSVDTLMANISDKTQASIHVQGVATFNATRIEKTMRTIEDNVKVNNAISSDSTGLKSNVVDFNYLNGKGEYQELTSRNIKSYTNNLTDNPNLLQNGDNINRTSQNNITFIRYNVDGYVTDTTNVTQLSTSSTPHNNLVAGHHHVQYRSDVKVLAEGDSGDFERPATKFIRTHANMMHNYKGYPPHAIHGLVWEEREYLLSVLIPVILGILGALMIVCVAFAARSCNSGAAIHRPRIMKVRSPLPYFDRVMLLHDSSDDEAHRGEEAGEA